MSRAATPAVVCALALVWASPGATQAHRGPPPPPASLTIEGVRAQFVARAGSDTVYFAGTSFTLDPPARATLVAQAQWLLANPAIAVRIEGHCDSGDSADHALALGERRAQAVRSYLQLLGVPAARIAIISWGRERPARGDDSAMGRALDRRAVTLLVP